MKIQVISRNPDNYLRETKRDIHPVQRNYDPVLHPFHAPREYVRALNAVKLEKVFARPFLASIDGHKDAIDCMCKHPSKLSTVISGSSDGEVKIWNVPQRRCVGTVLAHTGLIRGLCFHHRENDFFSVGDDQTIKRWSISGSGSVALSGDAVSTIVAKTILNGISHHYSSPQFATSGERVDIWDENRAEPLHSYKWGADGIYGVKFNPIETNIVSACGSDRSIIIYDIRESNPVRKVILKLRSNAIAWNPIEAYIFTAANEDHTLHSFDFRSLKSSCNIFKDHVDAVIDVDYSPTGKELVSGSYDKTLRIFPTSASHSREVYHTKRMQRVKCVLWTLDNKFIMSASDEMNIRVWKANASEKLGVLPPRELASLSYAESLKEKFGNHPQIRRISRHRHVSKLVLNQRHEKHAMLMSRKRKESNVIKHSKPGTVEIVAERKKHIVADVE
ncbi:hypothetical protein CHUAL_000386 [Chamberlinius hualienensis]